METAKKHLQVVDTSAEVTLQEKAFLVHGSERFPIEAKHTSKYSLCFQYKEKHHNSIDIEGPVSLLFEKNGDSFELGPCSVIKRSDLNGFTRRLVFLQDVYDLDYLFYKKKIKKLQTPLHSLPGLLARKALIKPSFREFTSNLSYDLSIYKNSFDSLDSEYCKEPEEVRQSVQKALINSAEKNFISYLDEQLIELSRIVSNFGIEEHQCHGFYFRKLLWNFILCCPLIARSNLKPRGYPGDFEMMRMIYQNDYQGETTFSKLMHKHAVSHSAAKSVRNRIKLIAALIRSIRDNTDLSLKPKLKLLSVGSGSAFELQDILQSPQDCKSYHFHLLDQDSLALSEASKLIDGIKRKFDQDIETDFLKYSVRTMLFSRDLKEKFGKFHFIYSLGLFDYFSDSVAKVLMQRLYQLLEPGGRMIIGNFHVSNPSRFYMEYWCDWFLVHRTEDNYLNLTRDCSAADVSIIFEDTGSQMFLDIHKHEDAA